MTAVRRRASETTGRSSHRGPATRGGGEGRFVRAGVVGAAGRTSGALAGGRLANCLRAVRQSVVPQNLRDFATAVGGRRDARLPAADVGIGRSGDQKSTRRARRERTGEDPPLRRAAGVVGGTNPDTFAEGGTKAAPGRHRGACARDGWTPARKTPCWRKSSSRNEAGRAYPSPRTGEDAPDRAIRDGVPAGCPSRGGTVPIFVGRKWDCPLPLPRWAA